jgi:hypothetical protein
MQVSVLIERVPGNGYRAKGGEPFGLSAEGATRDESLQGLDGRPVQRHCLPGA